MEEIRAAIAAFLKNAKQPALLEPGEELLPLTEDNFALDLRGGRLTLQAWDRTRNLTRRVTGIQEADAARAWKSPSSDSPRREGQLFLLDLARRAGADLGRRSARLVFRERFRLFLRRQFPEWKLAELSAEAEPGIQPLAGLPARLSAPRAARLGGHRLPARKATPRRCFPSA